jgi:hypothetical protein
MSTARYDRGVTGKHLAAARRLASDAVTAEVVDAMRARDIPVLLFKGPVLERWLYDDGKHREYGDIDLLVAPDRFAAAERVLSDVGFRMTAARWRPFEFQEHEHEWTRGSISIDLHRGLWGFDRDWHTVWETLSSGVTPVEVGGIEVEAPRSSIQALMVAAHAVQHAGRGHPLEDLRRAIAIADDSTWREAAGVAVRVGALGPLTLALGMLEEGRQLLERIELDAPADAEAHLRAGGAVPGSLTLLRFAQRRTVSARLSLVIAKLGPSPAFLRFKYPIARRGRLGLLAAYAWRPVWICLHAPAGWRAWRSAEAAARGRC